MLDTYMPTAVTTPTPTPVPTIGCGLGNFYAGLHAGQAAQDEDVSAQPAAEVPAP